MMLFVMILGRSLPAIFNIHEVDNNYGPFPWFLCILFNNFARFHNKWTKKIYGSRRSLCHLQSMFLSFPIWKRNKGLISRTKIQVTKYQEDGKKIKQKKKITPWSKCWLSMSWKIQGREQIKQACRYFQ